MRNKYIVAVILIILLALIIIFFPKKTAETDTQDTPPTEAAQIQNELPNMRITTLDGQQRIVSGYQGKAILFMFQPECDDCQREAVQIRENIDAFRGYTLYFISSSPREQIAAFREDYNLDQYDNIVFAETTVPEVINTLGPIPAPSIYIYSEHGRLVKNFKGETPIENILPHL